MTCPKSNLSFPDWYFAPPRPWPDEDDEDDEDSYFAPLDPWPLETGDEPGFDPEKGEPEYGPPDPFPSPDEQAS